MQRLLHGSALLAWLPLPALPAVMLALWAADLQTTYEWPRLQTALNFFTRTAASVLIVFLAGRSFLERRAPALLLVGCGVATWGAAGVITTAIVTSDANLGVTISNLGLWLAGLLHLAGAVIAVRFALTIRSAGAWLGLGYALALSLMGLVTLATFAGWLPVFFVQGQGGTLVRHVVLASAIAMFVLTAVLLWEGNRPSLSPFLRWYALALLLIAVGLFGVMIESSRNTLLDWTCRSAQYLSGIYMLIAALALRRDSGERQITLGGALYQARCRYSVAIVLVLAAAALRLAFLHALGGRAAFVTFYPAVILTALYGGVRPGLLAAFFSGVLVDCLLIQPAGRFSLSHPGHWLLLGAFWTGCALICWIVEVMKRAHGRAHRAEAQVQFAAERERAAALLRLSDERFRRVVENISDAVIVDDVAGNIVFANDQFLSLYGWSREELPNLRLEDYVAPERRAELRDRHDRRVRGEQVPTRFEYQGVRKDGKRIWVEVIVVPVHDEAGRVTGTQSCIRDVTERKRVDEALRESERRYRTLFETAPDAIVVHRDGRFLYANDAALALTGAGSFAELACHTTLDFFPSQAREEAAERTRMALSGDKLPMPEATLRRLNGHEAVVEFHTAPLDLRGTRAILTVIRDVTERRRLEQERDALLHSERAARTDAERASRMKDDFVAVISHELRNPLHAMLGWAQVLRAMKAMPAAAIEGLEAIHSSGRTLANMITDLLDVSRITAGKLRLQMRATQIESVLRAAADVVRPAAEAKGIQLALTVADDTGAVRADPERLKQVIWNLLSNAVKFTASGGSVRAAARRVNAQIEISVCDTGQGIEPEFLAHVFERFRQADASAARQHGGLGLGLSIVRSLVELHGGTVAAASPGRGRGATFTVKLPVSAAVESQPRPSGEPPQPYGQMGIDFESICLAGLKILAVDDQRESLELVKRVLEERHAKIFTAISASEGLAVLQRVRPDVLISDIGMPGEDGYTFVRRVRALEAECGGATPAVALTAFASLEDHQRAIACGYQAHVPKPVDVAQLIATLAGLVGRIACVPLAPESSGSEQS